MKLKDLDGELIKRLSGKVYTITMGGDPEFFVADKSDKILSADKFFPSKENPVMVSSQNEKEGSRVFFDGIQGEMAVAFSTCREYFASNVRKCLLKINEIIPKNHKILLKPSTEVDKKVIEKASPEARVFGCEPDYNAYTLSVNTPEMDASRHPYRYAGGHIHLGLHNKYAGKDHPEFRLAMTEEGHIRAVKFLDLIVSIPTFFLDCNDDAKRRRNKYGKSGCFRPTPYGIEYRTPSCWWLRSPITVSLVMGLARTAWGILVEEREKAILEAIGFSEEDIRFALDENDEKMVKKIWDNLRTYLMFVGYTYSNPLFVTSLVTTANDYIEDLAFTPIKAGNLPMLQGKPVFALAAFEYAVLNGLDVLADSDMRKAWKILENERSNYLTSIGFVNGAYKQLIDNKDFHKFQASFLKELFPDSSVCYY